MVRNLVYLLLLIVGGASSYAEGDGAAGKTCSVKSASSSTVTEAAGSTKSPARTLLFFMNPHGRPCQMQDEILAGLKDSISSQATLRYYKTTESSDHAAFGQYGIRGLPSLVLIDKNGKTIHRFTPGINDAGTIIKAVRN